MDKRELDRAEELLHKSLKEINDKGDYNVTSLDIVGKTVDALKDICEIKEKNGESYGSSGMWTAEGSYGRHPMYYGDNYRSGRYGHNGDMIDRLRRDMQNASSEAERDYIRRLLRQYE
jgi:hypothetical protein